MKDNKKAAADLFKKNANADKLFFTNDGQCFEKEWAAKVHAKETGDEKAIETITRADVAETADAADKEKAKAKAKLQKALDALKVKKADAEAALAGADEKKAMKISTSIAGIDEQIAAIEAEIGSV
jgi:dipeptidase